MRKKRECSIKKSVSKVIYDSFSLGTSYITLVSGIMCRKQRIDRERPRSETQLPGFVQAMIYQNVADILYIFGAAQPNDSHSMQRPPKILWEKPNPSCEYICLE